MKFKKFIYYCLSLRDKNFWLYLALFIANTLITLGCIEYFSTQESDQNIAHFANNYARKISDRLLLELDDLTVKKVITSKDQTVDLDQEFIAKYLSAIEPELLTLIVIVDRDGTIIASNFDHNLETRHNLKQGKILGYIKPKLANFSSLNQPEQLNFSVDRQQIMVRITPWKNRELGLDWFAIVIVPRSELAIGEINGQDDWIARYSAYLFPIMLLEIIYLGRVLLSKKSTQAVKNRLPPKREVVAQTEQNLSLREQDNLIVENSDKTSDSSPSIPGDYQAYFLLAEMSHELRSPLNAILGFAQIMEQELPTKSRSQENIAIINRNGDRLLSIINDVVDLAKIETNRLTLERNNIDFYAWLDNLEQSLPFYSDDQDWEFSLTREDNLPQYICIDERRLRQIIGNLIDYCLQSTSLAEINLRVTACCSGNQIDRTKAQNSPPKDLKDLIQFEVKNPNFVGSNVNLATLFEPLVRVKQEQKSIKGSSLNLPLSLKLAQLMDGDLIVGRDTLTEERDQGQGLAFQTEKDLTKASISFNLSIKAENIFPQQIPIQSTVQRIIGLESDQIEYRILIVDDSKTNRKIMSQLLESVGFQVQEAVNGKDAIDVWLYWQPHMIWMDLKMPVMNGCEATERIKFYAHDTHIPIVALSASSLEEEKSLLTAAGCDDFVAKPFSENIIFDKIAQHLGIRYVYEANTPLSSSKFKLTANSLNIMPQPWLEQAGEAALNLDQDLLIRLLQEIPVQHTDLKNTLQKQINNFDFDQILNLTRNSKNN